MKAVLIFAGVFIGIAFSFAGDIHIGQKIAVNLDRIVRSKNPDEAVELLEFIERQKIPVSFNVEGGPFDKEQELFVAIRSLDDYITENKQDSRWGRLARTTADDRDTITQMLVSKNAGERTLALEKLWDSNYQGGLDNELQDIMQNDPLVYFYRKRKGMRLKNEERDDSPYYGQFHAPLRSMARAVLEKQGIEVVAVREFEARYEKFGVERLIKCLSSKNPDIIGGVLYSFYRMDPESLGGKYLDSLDHHEMLTVEYLNLLKQHLHKIMKMPGRVFPEDLRTVLETGEKESLMATNRSLGHVEESRIFVVKKDVPIEQKQFVEKDIKSGDRDDNAQSESMSLIAKEPHSNVQWNLILSVASVVLIGSFALFKFRK